MRKDTIACLRLSLVSASVGFLLTGCALQTTSPATPEAGVAFHGNVHGGQQPIAGAQVYLYTANTTGYGGNGITTSSSNRSVSLLNSSVLINNPQNSGQDGNGNYYVTSASDGSFTITGDYICSIGQQLYMYAVGGNSGDGTNLASGLLAALGDCSSINSNTYIAMNEVSTVAAAYALAGFASDATHISSSGNALAQKGIANAFNNAANLATLSSGTALATTPGGNGVAPQTEINSLANILAACVNSSGPNSSACSTLLATATSTGAAGGIQPADTATAAIYIAQNPAANVEALYNIATSTVPFNPALTAEPDSWAIALNFTGGGLNSPFFLAIDASGNIWVPNFMGNSLSEFSSTGRAISSSNGYTGGGLDYPHHIAIDTNGDVWVTNGIGTLSEFSSTGSAISTSAAYTGAGLDGPDGIAIDANNDVWIPNVYGSLSEFSSAGTAISGSNGYTGGGLVQPYGPAIDSNGNIWTVNYTANSLSEFSSAGAAISGSNGYSGGGLDENISIAIDSAGNIWTANNGDSSLSEFSSTGSTISGVSGYTGGGLDTPFGIAIDGSENVWIVDGQNSLSEFSSTGTAISGSSGYTGGGLNLPYVPTIDGSGNVWTANQMGNSLTEFIGIATPVVTPIVTNLTLAYGHPASRP